MSANRERGHQLQNLRSTDGHGRAEQRTVDALIVGGGVAGLSSLCELRHRGVTDCVLLELEDEIGGTAGGGRGEVSAYPWGAHYLPAPFAENAPLVELLREMGVVTGFDSTGEPVYDEVDLCRDPQERLFADGAWHEDLLPMNLSAAERSEWDRFRGEVDKWIAWPDESGKRAFAIPSELGSTAVLVQELDRIAMSDWLAQNGFRSPFVGWQVDYACRDDYGMRPESTSAWAGLFYFASRTNDPDRDSQPFLTWPEGNARIVNYLSSLYANEIHCGQLVTRISPRDDWVDVRSIDSRTDQSTEWRARRVIFAAAQVLAPFIIDRYAAARGEAARQFTYAPWLVANLHLSRRPLESGFPLAWDNVLRDANGLGYVVATHQLGQDYGPSIFTYYLPLCDEDPRSARQRLQDLTWEQAAEMVLSDLEQAHPDLRENVERLDVMNWGHGMIRSVPGFRFGAARLTCCQPFGRVFFANTDLSGIALLEEAFHHGIRAASESAGV